MPRPRTYKTEAIVLRYSDLGEADRLLTLFTPQLGKLRAVARGVRKPRSRLAGHLQPLNRLALMLARGRNLDIVTQAQLLGAFLGHKPSLEEITRGLYLAELVDRFVPEGVEQGPLYRLLGATLDRLVSIADSPLPLRYFELQLLESIGYRPQLSRCVACGVAPPLGSLFFSPSGGGLLCPRCRATEPLVRPLSSTALGLLQALQQHQPLHSIPAEVAAEVEALLRQYLVYLLERDLRSATLLDSLRREALGARSPP